jgi:hypothetical protein
VVRATAITPKPVAGRAAHGIHRVADDARLVRKDGPTARISPKTHVRGSSRSGAERPIAPANRQASRTAVQARRRREAPGLAMPRVLVRGSALQQLRC